MTRHCLACHTATLHRHIHDTAHGIPETHIAGSERFVCTSCGRATFAYSDGAASFPFLLDTLRLIAGKAA